MSKVHRAKRTKANLITWQNDFANLTPWARSWAQQWVGECNAPTRHGIVHALVHGKLDFGCRFACCHGNAFKALSVWTWRSGLYQVIGNILWRYSRFFSFTVGREIQTHTRTHTHTHTHTQNFRQKLVMCAHADSVFHLYLDKPWCICICIPRNLEGNSYIK